MAIVGLDYKVELGDTLTLLARRFLGHDDFDVIYQANRSLIKNPDMIPVGITLKIPINERRQMNFIGQKRPDGFW